MVKRTNESTMRPDPGPERTVKLRDESELELFKLRCPIPESLRGPLTVLRNTQWQRGDFHWDESMAGRYADSLTIVTYVGIRQDRWVGTATISYAAQEAEIGTVCDVLTHAETRGLGIARALTEALCEHFLELGGRSLYLGTERDGVAWRVYERVGFQWFHGVVMRHVPTGPDAFDDDYFAADQPASIRPTEWGDLPGVSALFAAPNRALAGDYTRGIFSSAQTFIHRCVSVFPTIYYDVEAKGGRCMSLIGQRAHRVLGLASITPLDTEYRKHVGVLEVMTHDHHEEHGPDLVLATLAAAQDACMRQVIAYVPLTDEAKAQWLLAANGRSVGRLHKQIQLNDRSIDVDVMEIRWE